MVPRFSSFSLFYRHAVAIYASVNEFGELVDDRKWKELHYQEVRKEKEEAKEFDLEIREELTAGRGRGVWFTGLENNPIHQFFSYICGVERRL